MRVVASETIDAVADLAHPSTAPTVSDPLYTAVPNLVYGATGGLVEYVVIDGEVVLGEGEVRTIEEARVLKEAGERAERLFADAGDDWQAAGSELADRADEGWL